MCPVTDLSRDDEGGPIFLNIHICFIPGGEEMFCTLLNIIRFFPEFQYERDNSKTPRVATGE